MPKCTENIPTRVTRKHGPGPKSNTPRGLETCGALHEEASGSELLELWAVPGKLRSWRQGVHLTHLVQRIGLVERPGLNVKRINLFKTNQRHTRRIQGDTLMFLIVANIYLGHLLTTTQSALAQDAVSTFMKATPCPELLVEQPRSKNQKKLPPNFTSACEPPFETPLRILRRQLRSPRHRHRTLHQRVLGARQGSGAQWHLEGLNRLEIGQRPPPGRTVCRISHRSNPSPVGRKASKEKDDLGCGPVVVVTSLYLLANEGFSERTPCRNEAFGRFMVS